MYRDTVGPKTWVGGAESKGNSLLLTSEKVHGILSFSFKIKLGRVESAWNFTPALRNLHLLLCEALEAEQGWLGTSSCLETRVGLWDVVKDEAGCDSLYIMLGGMILS